MTINRASLRMVMGIIILILAVLLTILGRMDLLIGVMFGLTGIGLLA